MIYVALLRGINVGGKNKIDMKLLKTTFERVGMMDVETYINTGNIIFSSNDSSKDQLSQILEQAIHDDFGLQIKVMVRSIDDVRGIIEAIPDTSKNDKDMKSDVMFLWEDVASPDVLDQLTIRSEIDKVKYIDGTVIWHVTRQNQTKSGLLKIMGTSLYKRMSIRNSNTLRKLCELMEITNGN